MNVNDTDEILFNEINKNKTPSVNYVVLNQSDILYHFKKGYANLETKQPVDLNTRYNLFSITKTFTALAIMQLAQQDKLHLNDRVISILPDFPYHKETLITHLLSHSAGIPNPIPLNWIHLATEHEMFNSKAFYLNVLKKHPKPKAGLNEKFNYSNIGYMILGEIIEKVSGRKYEDYVRDNILKTIGINTGELDFVVSGTDSMVTGYHKKNGFSSSLLRFMLSKSKYMGTPQGKWQPFNPVYVNGSSYGGLIGSPNALIKFLRFILKQDSEVLEVNYKKLLFTENYTSLNKPTGMCLAWFKSELNGHVCFSHAGGGGGYYGEIRIYPDLNLGSIIMFNRSGMSNEKFLDKTDRFVLNEIRFNENILGRICNRPTVRII